jgi:sterol desaturase/sphingolipid hydroxylase (fatty acid hydroxylase superfamily)
MELIAWSKLILGEAWGSVWPQWSIAALAFVAIHMLFRRYFGRRRIQERSLRRRQLSHEILFSLLTLLSGNGIGLSVAYLSNHGLASVQTGPVGPGTIAVQFSIYFVLFDVCFYAIHRLMHSRALYWLHEFHHRSETPNPLTAFSFHPVEGLISGGFVVLMVYLFEFHVYTVFAVNAYGACQSVLIHCGHEMFPRRWYENKLSRLYISPSYHDKHHSTYRYNFGGFTSIWDRLFGTMHPSFESDYRALQDRILLSAHPPAAGRHAAAPTSWRRDPARASFET